MKEKLLIFFALISTIAILSVVYFYKANSDLKEQVLSFKNFYGEKICFPVSLQEIADNGEVRPFGEAVVFASASNFKEGLPGDLPEGFKLYPETKKVYSFPNPYFQEFRVERGMVIFSDAGSEKMFSFYENLSEEGWNVEKIENKKQANYYLELKKNGQSFKVFLPNKTAAIKLPFEEGSDIGKLIYIRY